MKMLVFRSQKFRIDGRLSVNPAFLEIRPVAGKGEGLFSTSPIEQGEFVCEYKGELLSNLTASKKRNKWPPDVDDWTTEGNFSFFFETKSGQQFCIDANNSTCMGRKINHSRKKFNVKPIVIEEVKGKPRLFFKAVRNIPVGEEILYDYGEKAQDILLVHPWLCE